MRQRLDRLGIDLLQPRNVIEDGAELASHGGQFRLAQFQPGQVRHPANVVGRQRHDPSGRRAEGGGKKMPVVFSYFRPPPSALLLKGWASGRASASSAA